MADRSLHPNLARMASAYDEVVSRFNRNQLTASEARAEILALVARDDNGVLWSIDPQSGNWLRRTVNNKMVEGTPPTYGLATPTAHDLSRNEHAFNPDSNVQFQEVDESLLNAPDSLIGATRRRQQPKKNSVQQFFSTTPRRIGAGLAIAALLILAGGKIFGGSEEPQAPAPSEDTVVSETIPEG